MTVLITGGTGTLGQAFAPAAEAAGHTVRLGSRRSRPPDCPPSYEWAPMQIAAGEGVAEAVTQVDAVIHAASDPRHAEAVDVDGTRHLVEAAHAAGVPHLLYVSIVGIDAIPLGYYQRKLAAEQIVRQSPVPYSILRATQFHPFVDMLLSAAARVPFVIPLPTDFQVQSVAPAEVAARLVRCLEEGPAERLADFGGPEAITLAQAAADWKRITGVDKRVLHMPIPGTVAAGFRAGKNVVRSGEHGTIRWVDWLRERTAGTKAASA